MDSMYEILMGLPLFNGVSRERISEVVGRAPFHFLKYLEGEKVIEPGEAYTHIKFVISGAVRSTITSPNGRFQVSQTLQAPNVIAPEFLFGRNTSYPAEVVALEPAGIMQIAKTDYVDILNADKVFLFNFLNTLSVNAQKAIDGVLAVAAGSLEERIAFWIIALTQRGGTDVKLVGRQRDLYSLFGVQRTSFISTLESMRERGIIEYDQHEIRVKSRRTLLGMLSTDSE